MFGKKVKHIIPSGGLMVICQGAKEKNTLKKPKDKHYTSQYYSRLKDLFCDLFGGFVGELQLVKRSRIRIQDTGPGFLVSFKRKPSQ